MFVEWYNLWSIAMSRCARRYFHSVLSSSLYWYYHINISVICSAARQQKHWNRTWRTLCSAREMESRRCEDKEANVKLAATQSGGFFSRLFLRALMFYAWNILLASTHVVEVASILQQMGFFGSVCDTIRISHTRPFADESFSIFVRQTQTRAHTYYLHDHPIKYCVHRT